jgi:hypothetical protein
MAQRRLASSAAFIAIVFAIAVAIIFAVSVEFPDMARAMGYLLAWLVLVAIVFRGLELAFEATPIGKRKAAARASAKQA